MIWRIFHSLAALVWSAVILVFYASGRLNAYLAPDFRFIALCGGLGLAVLGLFHLFTAGKMAHCCHDHDEGDGHHHEVADLHPLVSFMLMVMPVLLCASWTKDQYSMATLARKGAYDAPAESVTPFIAASMPPLTREMIEGSHRKTAEGFHEFNLLELFFATGDRELQNAIEGLPVQTEGRWIEEKNNNPEGRRKRLYRLFMTCCAADSRAIPIVLEFKDSPPDFPENTWIKVAGTMRFPLVGGILQPVLEAENAVAGEPPREESFLRN